MSGRSRARRWAALVVALATVAACSADGDVRSVDRQPAVDDSRPPGGSGAPVTTVPDGTDVPGTTDAPAGTDPGRPPGERGACAPDVLVPSEAGAGDPLFPDLGNPDLDVQHYDVELTYDPVTDDLSGVVTIEVDVTADRPSITLDSAALAVAEVTVDGAPATFQSGTAELEITPATPFTHGSHTVVVRYTADTVNPVGADGLPLGWFDTEGGSYVLNEPDGARTWLPSNDHPSDRATFRFTIHVPAGLTAVANGALDSHTTGADGETWVWREDVPMATYLVQVLTGDYEIIQGSGPHGLPLISAVLRSDVDRMQSFLDVTPEQIAFFEDLFGPYPLDRYGLAMTDSTPGLAMETFGRSLFSRLDFPTSELGLLQHLLLSHELAHQWFGDAVSPARWQDIWLNESFATYGQWLWLDHVGLIDIDTSAQLGLSRGPGATADPTAATLFGFNSYDGGAVVLHALRATIGDEAFFELLRRWVADNEGESCTTGGFIALSEQVAGRDLRAFYDEWLFADVTPDAFPGQ